MPVNPRGVATIVSGLNMAKRKDPGFLFVNARPDGKLDEQTTQSINKHVMLNYFTKREKGHPQKDAAGATSSSDTKSTSTQKSNTTSAKAKNPRRKLPKPKPPEKAISTKAKSAKSASPEIKSESTISPIEVIPSPVVLEATQNQTLTARNPGRVIGASRADPFDTLSVNGVQNTHDLVKWLFYHPKAKGPDSYIDQFVLKWRQTAWGAAKEWPAIFHTLACVALTREQKVTGVSQRSRYYHHRIQALREIHAGLQGMRHTSLRKHSRFEY